MCDKKSIRTPEGWQEIEPRDPAELYAEAERRKKGAMAIAADVLAEGIAKEIKKRKQSTGIEFLDDHVR